MLYKVDFITLLVWKNSFRQFNTGVVPRWTILVAVSVQLGGGVYHWSVLRQLATLDSVSPIGTLIAIVVIFDEVSALTSTE